MNNALGQPIVHKKAVLQSTLEVMKERFYVDRWFPLNNGDGSTSYIGIIYPGSTNWQMHADNRRGNGGTALGTWLNEPLLTLDVAYWTTSPIVAYANYIIIPSFYKAAWYVNSDRIGYQVRKYGESNWITPTPQRGLSAQQTITEDSSIIIFGNPFQAGDRLELRAFNTNAEGTYYSSIIEVVVSDGMNSYPAGFATNGGEHDAPTVVVFLGESVKTWLESISITNTNLPSGRYIYKGVNSSGNGIPADAGWYYDLGQNYIAFRINSAGMVVESFKRNPPDVPPTWDVEVRFIRTFPNPITGEMNYVVSVSIPSNKTTLGVALTISGNYRMNPISGGSGPIYPYSITLPAGQKSASQVLQTTNVAAYNVVFNGIQTVAPSGIVSEVKYTDWIE